VHLGTYLRTIFLFLDLFKTSQQRTDLCESFRLWIKHTQVCWCLSVFAYIGYCDWAFLHFYH
jgi:hypothetical protein